MIDTLSSSLLLRFLFSHPFSSHNIKFDDEQGVVWLRRDGKGIISFRLQKQLLQPAIWLKSAVKLFDNES